MALTSLKHVPLEYKGKRLAYRKVFVSPMEYLTESGALRALDKIRAEHPESKGWLEIYGGVEQLNSGVWRAVCQCARYF